MVKMKKSSPKKSRIASRFAKKEKTLMINVLNKRDDAKFERIKPTVLSNSNWIMTDLKSKELREMLSSENPPDKIREYADFVFSGEILEEGDVNSKKII